MIKISTIYCKNVEIFSETLLVTTNLSFSLALRIVPHQLAFYDPNQEIVLIDEDKNEHTMTGRELGANAQIALECDVALRFVCLKNINQ